MFELKKLSTNRRNFTRNSAFLYKILNRTAFYSTLRNGKRSLKFIGFTSNNEIYDIKLRYSIFRNCSGDSKCGLLETIKVTLF